MKQLADSVLLSHSATSWLVARLENRELADGDRRFTPQLDAMQARKIADALAAQEPPRPGHGETLMLSTPLKAEARLGSSRHPTVRFARVKADQD